MIMTKVFHTVFLQQEFNRLYRNVIPVLNECDFCGKTKCTCCNKFNVSCLLCRTERCKKCASYFNIIRFLFEKTNKSQWDYIWNFLYDLFRVHWVTEKSFKDLRPISSNVKYHKFNISVSHENQNNSIRISGNKVVSYFLWSLCRKKIF